MYSLSRHLITSHVGNNLRQICSDSGIKCSSLLRMSGTTTCNKVPVCGRRYYNKYCNNSGDAKTVFFRGSLARFNDHPCKRQFSENNCCQLRHAKSVCNQSRCYSRSAEKIMTQEEKTAGEGTKSESSLGPLEPDDECVDLEENELYLTEAEIQELTQGHPDLIKKINYIQLEFSVMKQDGEKVPSFVKMKHWKELLPLDSRSKRKKYYLFLFKTEMSEIGVQRKKIEKREARMKLYAENPLPTREEDVYGTCYALSRNCIFLRLYDSTINKHYNAQVAKAMQHHPPLVIDCSYDEFMNIREAKNCAKQLELVITDNKQHREPFNLYLCNAATRSTTMDYLYRKVPTIGDDAFALNIHTESFMDLFPRDRLVYLTPHTRDDLEEYNEDDIYIIGAMVDKSDNRPHSLAIAKRLGIRMRKLPLDKHLMWGTGGKSLTVNQMIKIMLDVRYTRGDWKQALQHVPMRKLNRTFHPYPDQVQNQFDEASHPEEAPFRKERKSRVMEDFELLHRRKGFQRSTTFSSMNPRRNQAVHMPRVKSLLQDDD